MYCNFNEFIQGYNMLYCGYMKIFFLVMLFEFNKQNVNMLSLFTYRWILAHYDMSIIDFPKMHSLLYVNSFQLTGLDLDPTVSLFA